MEIPFCFRLKIGEEEIEISGTRDEVIKTLEDLPRLIENILIAFEETKSGEKTSQAANPVYPSISVSNCSEAILQLLASNWGNKPRTLPELREALKANAVDYPSTTMSGVLAWLVRKNKIKRWKTDKGYVYVLAQGRLENEKNSNTS